MSGPPMIKYAALHDFPMQTPMRRVRALVLRWLRWTLGGIGLLGVFIGIFLVLQRSYITATVGLIVCLLSTTIVASFIRAARRQRAMALVAYCEQGVRLALPLPEFLRAVAANESKHLSQRLTSIAATLEAPAQLGGAISSEVPELPRRVTDIVRAAEANGTLPGALSRLVNEETPPSPDETARPGITLVYVTILIAGMLLPITFIAIFVMPKMDQIYRDFGMQPPGPWMYVNRLDETFILLTFFAVCLIVIALLLAILARNARWIFFRRLEHDQPFRKITDRILWHLPLLGPQFCDRDMADVCQSIADGLEQRRPIEATVRDAASHHLNDVLITRIDDWHQRLAHGETLATSARAARMPSLVSDLIGNASTTSDGLSSTFAFLARHYRGQASERAAWLAASVLPVVTLVAGAIVASIVLMLWVPLVGLIDASLPYRVGL